MLFEIKDKKIKRINEEKFNVEKDLQLLIERNLCDFFPDLKLSFIKSEFTIGEFRFDSVAFDENNKIFYILEYKNIEKKSLLDQGYAYLKTLLDRKYDFINLLEEAKKIEIKSKAIDWSSTRVIFIAPSYNNYQLKITESNNSPFLFYKFSKYSNNMFTLEKMHAKKTSDDSINNLLDIENQEKTKEIKVYSENDFLVNITEKLKNIYEVFKSKILDIDSNIIIEPKKCYIAFKGVTNICDVEFFKSFLKVYINLRDGQIDDPFKIAQRMVSDNGKKTGHHGNGDYLVKIDNEQILDKLIFLIKQSYEING